MFISFKAREYEEPTVVELEDDITKEEAEQIEEVFREAVKRANIDNSLYGTMFNIEQIIDNVLADRKHKIFNVKYRLNFIDF